MGLQINNMSQFPNIDQKSESIHGICSMNEMVTCFPESIVPENWSFTESLTSNASLLSTTVGPCFSSVLNSSQSIDEEDGDWFVSSTDRYGGFTVEISSSFELSNRPRVLYKLHQVLNERYFDTKIRTIWVSVAEPFTWSEIEKILPEYFHMGIIDDRISGMVVDYQSKQRKYKFWYWKGLPEKCHIPPGANINCGATALLLDRKNHKVCLVAPSDRSRFFNYPGGNMDLNDKWSFINTAKREACEEMGFTREDFDKHMTKSFIAGILCFPNNQLAGAINITVCFYVDGLSEIETNFDKREITIGGWMDIGDVLSCDGVKEAQINGKFVGSTITASLKSALSGNGFWDVDCGMVWSHREIGEDLV